MTFITQLPRIFAARREFPKFGISGSSRSQSDLWGRERERDGSLVSADSRYVVVARPKSREEIAGWRSRAKCRAPRVTAAPARYRTRAQRANVRAACNRGGLHRSRLTSAISHSHATPRRSRSSASVINISGALCGRARSEQRAAAYAARADLDARMHPSAALPGWR